MKSKLFFAALAAGAGICAFAQSADELNVEKLTAKLAETKAENWWQIGNLQVKLELAKKTPETFDEMLAAIRAGADKVTFANETQKNKFISGHISALGRWWYKGKFMREAFEYVKTSGTKSDLVNFLAFYNAELGLEDAELYKRSVDLALSVELSAKNALRLVRQIVRLAPGQDETTVKSDLKLESKETIRERVGFSPDRADALALTFAEPVFARRDFSDFSSRGASARRTNDEFEFSFNR